MIFELTAEENLVANNKGTNCIGRVLIINGNVISFFRSFGGS